MTAEPWVSMYQVREYLCAMSDSIYRWNDRNNLPAHRVGGLCKSKVSRWMSGCAPVARKHMACPISRKMRTADGFATTRKPPLGIR